MRYNFLGSKFKFYKLAGNLKQSTEVNNFDGNCQLYKMFLFFNDYSLGGKHWMSN